MKVTTDSCLFGAWIARELEHTITQNILDIGIGTGLLSLMLAQKTQAIIDAVELQKQDYQQAVENISNSPWPQRITVFNADAAAFHYFKKYDAIISNPPFYDTDLKSNNPLKNIAHHNEGLQLQSLIHIVKKNIVPSGRFFILYPAKRKNDLLKILSKENFYINSLIDVCHTSQHRPFRIMVQTSRIQTPLHKEIITIKNGENYSPEFTALLKDYYLHL